jgi:DNA polymerase-1
LQTFNYKIKGQPVSIRVIEDERDLPEFLDWARRHPLLGFDTETTGLDWWADAYRCRLVQFGTGSESYVIPVELGPAYEDAVRRVLEGSEALVAHNATFDLHTVERTLGIPMEALAPKTWDTKILAHLVDPRAVKERGPGLKLEELTKHYICETTADEVKGSMTRLAAKYKTTKDRIWKTVELFDPFYLLYAGMDPVLAFRLFQILFRLVPARTKAFGLIGWEHQLAHVTAKLERIGYLLDVEYAERCCDDLSEEQKHWVEVAQGYGVENINSNAQLIY